MGATIDVRKVLTASGTQVDAADFRNVTFRSTADRLLDGIAPIDFLWRHWIPRSRVIVIVGAGGVGKSSLLTGLAVARALGQPYFLGVPVKPGATLIALGEDYLTDGERRLSAWLDFLTDHKPTRAQSEQVARMVSFMVLTGTDTRLVMRPKREYLPDLVNARGIAAQILEMRPRPDLVIVETVARFGGDESNESHAAMISACETISQEADATVGLVSHAGKLNTREGTFDAYTARGGSALVDNARATIVFGHMPTDIALQKSVIGRQAEPSERKCYVLKLARATHAPPQDPIILRPRSNLDQLVLEPVEEIPAAVRIEARNGRNRVLAEAVRQLVTVGKVPTATVLRENLDLMKKQIGYRDVGEAIKDAIEDGILIESNRRFKGGRVLAVGSAEPPPAPVEVETDDWSMNVNIAGWNLN